MRVIDRELKVESSVDEVIQGIIKRYQGVQRIDIKEDCDGCEIKVWLSEGKVGIKQPKTRLLAGNYGGKKWQLNGQNQM